MQESIGPVLRRLRAQIASDNGKWGVTRIEIAGAGLQSLVFRAESRAFGPIAIRTPIRRWIMDDNDPCMDSRDLLRQEASLASHMLTFGVPVPQVHALVIEDHGLDFLVSEYIAHDGTAYDSGQIGELVRRIHDCPLPDIRPVAQTGRFYRRDNSSTAEQAIRCRRGRIRAAIEFALSGRIQDYFKRTR